MAISYRWAEGIIQVYIWPETQENIEQWWGFSLLICIYIFLLFLSLKNIW